MEDYRGAAQGSELEAQHIMAYFKQNAPIVGAVDMHSYGQLILRPWGMCTDVHGPSDHGVCVYCVVHGP